MAAAIYAIRRKKERRAAFGTRSDASDPANAVGGQPDFVAKYCACWAWFWSKTDIDEKFWSLQERISKAYLAPKAQVFVACFIFGNFIVTIAEKQFDPTGTLHPNLWFGFEVAVRTSTCDQPPRDPCRSPC